MQTVRFISGFGTSEISLWSNRHRVTSSVFQSLSLRRASIRTDLFDGMDSDIGSVNARNSSRTIISRMKSC